MDFLVYKKCKVSRNINNYLEESVESVEVVESVCVEELKV